MFFSIVTMLGILNTSPYLMNTNYVQSSEYDDSDINSSEFTGGEFLDVSADIDNSEEDQSFINAEKEEGDYDKYLGIHHTHLLAALIIQDISGPSVS